MCERKCLWYGFVQYSVAFIQTAWLPAIELEFYRNGELDKEELARLEVSNLVTKDDRASQDRCSSGSKRLFAFIFTRVSTEGVSRLYPH